MEKSMTQEERIEKLERENEELRAMLKKVARLAYYAYKDMKLSRYCDLPDEVYSFS